MSPMEKLLLNLMIDNWTRNNYNQVPATVTQIQKDMVPQAPNINLFHRIGPGNDGNVKYLSKDFHNEVVLSKDGRIVTDSVNLGTYNYGTDLSWRHTAYDVVPAILFGNSMQDFQNRSLLDRMWAPIDVWLNSSSPNK